MLLNTCGRELINFRTFKQKTALHLAAKRGNKTGVVALLRAGACVCLLDHKRRTSLLTVLHRQNDAMVRLMVWAGASVNRVPGWTRTPLHTSSSGTTCCWRGSCSNHGLVIVDLCNDDFNWTVIHSTCESGDVNMSKCLLAYAESQVHTGGWPRSLLLVAASVGRRPAVDALLACGVDVNARCGNGETALHAAARGNGPELVNRLLDAGPCVDAWNAKPAIGR